MPTIVIGSQVIDFPDDAASPDWAPPIIQFAQAVAAQLAISTGTYDVSPQIMTIDSYNVASNIDIAALSFPTSAVRAAFIRYAVYRTTNSDNADEAGDIIVIYNPNNSAGLKWSISQVRDAGKGAQIAFNITDTGQVQFSTTALAGTGHTGKLTFSAQAFQQS